MTKERNEKIISLEQPPYDLRKVSEAEFDKLCKEDLHVAYCPKCLNSPEIIIRIPIFGKETIKIKCQNCGYEKEFYISREKIICENSYAAPLTIKSFAETICKAIEYWNNEIFEK